MSVWMLTLSCLTVKYPHLNNIYDTGLASPRWAVVPGSCLKRPGPVKKRQTSSSAEPTGETKPDICICNVIYEKRLFKELMLMIAAITT